MENIINSNESQIENGESRSTEVEKLNDATTEPRSFVEQGGDYRQAEAVQQALSSIIDAPVGKASQGAEVEAGARYCCPPGELPDGSGYLGDGESETDTMAGQEEANTVMGRMPKLREDLSGLQSAGSGEGEKEEATPINLPGPQYCCRPGELPDGSGYLGGDEDKNDTLDGAGDEKTVQGSLPEMRTDFSEVMYEPGHPPEPKDLDHNTPPHDQVVLEETNTVMGRMPKLREDLSDLQPAGSGEGEKEEATPINLPGPQAAAGKAAAAPLAIPETAEQTSAAAQPVPVVIRVDGSEGAGLDPLGGKDIADVHSAGDLGKILPENLPEAKVLGIGMGAHGLIEKGVRTNTGLGGLVNGSGTSGGGPAVISTGGKGKEPGAPSGVDEKAWGRHQRSLDVQGMKEGGSTTVTDKDTGVTYTMGKDGVWRPQETDDETPPAQTNTEGDPIDGDFGMPYTGSGTGGSAPEPDILGGPDVESSHLTPIISIDGKGVSGGGTTEDGDDSGKFNGDPQDPALSASASRPNNPDDPDYYTPDILKTVGDVR
ncbi:MAG: hypothetical protein JXA13_08300 [Anaerolineales bacterium]|nr:hypothetical protein [Anaerolineales bacterium]